MFDRGCGAANASFVCKMSISYENDRAVNRWERQNIGEAAVSCCVVGVCISE